MKKRRCLFCGRDFTPSSKRAKEHIFPLWLQKALGVGKKPIYASHIRPYDKKQRTFFKPQKGDMGIKKISQRKHPLSGMVYGLICEKCNNGFLNDIENEARPLILKIISNKKVTLGKKEQEILSRWCYKTAIILNKASNFEKYFSESTYHNFFISKQPESDIKICVAKLNKGTKGDFWIQSRSFVFEFPRLSNFDLSTVRDRYSGITKRFAIVPKQAKIAQMIELASFNIVLNLNGFLIKVFYVPTKKYPIRLYEHKPEVFRIWPLLGAPKINWPPKDGFSNLVEFVANTRIKTLSS